MRKERAHFQGRAPCAAFIAFLCACTVSGEVLTVARIIHFSAPASSHWAQHGKIAVELAERGHHVMLVASAECQAVLERLGLCDHTNIEVTTFAAPFPIEGLRTSLRKWKGIFAAANATTTIHTYTNAIFEDQAALTKLRAFKADLLVGDAAIPTGYALADLLEIPKGALLIGGLLPPFDGDYGLSAANNLARVPQMNSGFSPNMNFWQRVQNAAIWAASRLIIRGLLNPAFSAVWIERNIRPHDARTSLEGVCVVIVTDDFALASSRPISPHIAVVGALTASPAKPLGSELEEYLQLTGRYGLVYASFGTTAVPEPHELKGVAAALAALDPLKALWKLTASEQAILRELGIHLGDNVRAVTWVPQNDLLGHPNVGAFLTQGGSNSVLEAMYHGVPLVGLPLVAEQPGNIAKAVHAGAGIAVSAHDRPSLAADLERALRAVLSDNAYREAAAVAAARMHARRRSPAELAADAVEHAAWTRGSLYLRGGKNRLTWYQDHLLDVLAFFAAAAIFFVALLCVLVVALCKVSSSQKKQKTA